MATEHDLKQALLKKQRKKSNGKGFLYCTYSSSTVADLQMFWRKTGFLFGIIAQEQANETWKVMKKTKRKRNIGREFRKKKTTTYTVYVNSIKSEATEEICAESKLLART
jgi:hypothetical protein